MRLSTLVLAAAATATAGLACAGRREPSPDDGPFDRPMLPSLSPCPSGWSAVVRDGATECDPWAGSARETCPLGQARFPGSATCEVIGTPCPSGEWPEGLPTDVPILYVRAGATGGDGSIAAPFGGAQTALDAATVAGTIVALSKGSFDGPLEIPGSVIVWGACVAETVVTAEYPLAVLAAGSTAGLRNLRVTGPVPGIWVQSTSIDVEDVVIDGAAQIGVFVHQGGHARLHDVAVQRTQRDPVEGTFGVGVSVETGGTLELDRVVIEASHATGLIATGASTSMTAADLAVLDTEPDADGALGRGIDVKGGAIATLERVVVQGNRGTGIYVADASTILALGDALVSDTGAESDGGGRGLNIQSGARVTSERLRVENSVEGGIVVLGASLEATQTIVRATRERATDLTYGRGIGLGGGATARLTTALVLDNRDVGVFVDEGASLSATDLTVLGTRGAAADGTGGRGLGIQRGAHAEVLRARIVDNLEAGVLVNENATAELHDMEVGGTREAECVVTTCPDFGLGDGVLVAFGSRATLDRFAVADNVRAGVVVGPLSEVDLSNGEIARNAIGASIQAEGFDAARLSHEVVYVDNGRNIDRSGLPLPAPSAGF